MTGTRVPGEGPAPVWPARDTRIAGVHTRVRETGGTPAVAYVHGLGGSALDWTDLGALLAPDLPGAALDLPGFGGSAPLRRYSLAALADHVTAWLAALGPVHLVGNSLGGAVTVLVAARRPDLVRTLTLISPAMPFLRPWQSDLGRLAPFAWLPGTARVLALTMARLGPDGLTRQSIESCTTDPASVPPDRLAAFRDEAERWLASPWHADAYVRTFRALLATFLRPGAGSPWSYAARIAVPTLVVWGRDDRLVPSRLGPRLAGTVPDCRLLVLDGVGHVAQVERPATVAGAIRALVDEHRAA
ncbi:alpha/beta fold hydrolase [Actinocatenispora rupis]|uniref:alpha/beta fold hydrolase n=1 Tax=Actinocatenispora rupis TaxID=519421 RepID=UPI0019404F65|nr:alpha/beta fold hydrolase [Actinocatenispora rupis]